MNRNTEYERMRLGLFVHYVYRGSCGPVGYMGQRPDGSLTESVDEMADGLDVDDLVSVAQSMCAEYLIFTTWHANMNALYPSEVLARMLPGHISKRDCICDLIEALKPTGIRLILYAHPSDGHDFSPEDQKLVGWNDGAPWIRWNDFINAVFDELVRRYRGDVLGYWIDGGDPPQIAVGLDRLYVTIREADPDVVIIRNDGDPGFAGFPDWTDYTCKETDYWPFNASTDAMASPISGTWWAHGSRCMLQPEGAFQNTVLQAATRGHTAGGTSWGAGPYPGGVWEPGVREFFRDLGALIEPVKETILGTVPSRTFGVDHNTRLRTPGLVAGTETPDGTTTYLHVLWPPHGKSIHLPQPDDGRRFSSAHLYRTGESVTIMQDDSGIQLTLGENTTWDTLDTIIVMR